MPLPIVGGESQTGRSQRDQVSLAGQRGSEKLQHRARAQVEFSSLPFPFEKAENKHAPILRVRAESDERVFQAALTAANLVRIGYSLLAAHQRNPSGEERLTTRPASTGSCSNSTHAVQ